jgi:hypothetical protein
MIDVDGGSGNCPGFRVNVGLIAIDGTKIHALRRDRAHEFGRCMGCNRGSN